MQASLGRGVQCVSFRLRVQFLHLADPILHALDSLSCGRWGAGVVKGLRDMVPSFHL